MYSKIQIGIYCNALLIILVTRSPLGNGVLLAHVYHIYRAYLGLSGVDVVALHPLHVNIADYGRRRLSDEATDS